MLCCAVLCGQRTVMFILEYRYLFFYQPIIEGSLSEFVKQALKPNTWGSYVELLAATKLLSINIVIVTGRLLRF